MSVVETITAPERTLAQRMSALERANDIRSRRAQLKRDIKAGQALLAELILDPPDWAHTMKILDALLATPKIGRVKANKALQAARVAPSKTLGGLTDRQRFELIAGLRR